MFKLVRESLQPLQFQRGLDPKEAMGIGKRGQIKAWLDEMEVEDYTINDDLTIDVKGDVDLWYKNLDRFPDYIQFGNVEGYFTCSFNNLTSLEGAPKSVGRYFFCHNNNLTSLEGASKTVGGSFSCSYNELITLEGAPKSVGGDFLCYNNITQFTVAEVQAVCNVKGDVYV